MKQGFFLFVLGMMLLYSCKGKAQSVENWTSNQLMEPAELAQKLTTGAANLPLIICVGPGATIPHSVDIGMTKDSANLVAFKMALTGIPKTKEVVIYCGCCPFAHCPNVRPAIAALKDMQFANYKLLNLPHNIKTDWIDKGYPQEKSSGN